MYIHVYIYVYIRNMHICIYIYTYIYMYAFHKYKLPPKLDIHTNSYKPKPEENKKSILISRLHMYTI